MVGEGEYAMGGEFLVELSSMFEVGGYIHRIGGEYVWATQER